MSSATTSRSGFDVRYRTIDLVTITTLGVAFGVIFWGWGKLYEPLSGLAVFSFPPSSALLGGVWLSAGVVGGLIVRKPKGTRNCYVIEHGRLAELGSAYSGIVSALGAGATKEAEPA